ncbi:MAG: EF-Tu/IF-2/RF-3 family GTPase [Pseudomonadota bacterium]
MAFFLTVEDVFSISGRGTVVTGTIEGGPLKVGDRVFIVKPDGTAVSTIITGIESFRNASDEAQPGEEVGLLLRGIARDEVARGDTISHTPSLPEPDQPVDSPPQEDPPGLAQLSLGGRPSDAPALLLPLRIETAFVGQRLLVRAYPDQIHIDAFDPALSDAEIALVKGAQDALASGTARSECMARLTDAAGPARAHYLSQFIDDIRFEATVARRGDLAFRNVAVARALPEQLVAKASLGEKAFFGQGAPIPRDLSLDAEAPWLTDFAEAQRVGLAVVITLDADAARKGIDGLHVLGLNTRADTRDELLSLFEHHRAGQGLTTLPTFSQTLGGSAPDWGALRNNRALDTALNVPLDLPPQPDPAPLLDLLFSVVWQASLRPALKTLYGLDDPLQLEEMHEHLLEHLAPFGPYPVLKVGPQPYAVAPISAGTGRGPLAGAAALFDQIRPEMAEAAENARADLRQGSQYETMAHTLLRTPIGQHWRLRTLIPVANVLGELMAATDLADRTAVAGSLRQARTTTREVAQLLLGDRDELANMGDWVPAGFAMNVCGPLVRDHAENLVKNAGNTVGDPGLERLLTEPDFWRDRIDRLTGEASETIPHAPLDDGTPEPVLRLYAENAILQMLSDYALEEGLRPEDDDARDALERLARQDGTAFGDVADWVLRHHLAQTTMDQGGGAPLLDLAQSLRPRTTEGRHLQRAIERVAKALLSLHESDAHAVHIAFAATLDCFSNRPDVWDMMAAQARLKDQRDAGQDDLALGGWGYVEDVRPETATREAAYLVAPSVKLATLFTAIERARAGLGASGLPDLVAARFDAATVANAKALIDAYEAGGAPDMVLSRLASTASQDRDAADKITDLVKRFPLAGAGELGTPSAFDGVAFLTSELPRSLGADVLAVQRELHQMVDDLGHILLADATGSLADRRLDTANAALNGLGVGARPPSDAAALGPTGTGSAQFFSVALLTDQGQADAAPIDLSARLAPRLAGLAARALGPINGRIAIGANKVAFETLQISPLTLTLLASTGAPPRETLETHMRLRQQVDPDAEIVLDDAAKATLSDAAALGQTIREARSLEPEDFPDQAAVKQSIDALVQDLSSARLMLTQLADRMTVLLDEPPDSPGIAVQLAGLAADLTLLGLIDVAEVDRLPEALASLRTRLQDSAAAETDEDGLRVLLGPLPFVQPLFTERVEAWSGAMHLTGGQPNDLALWLEDSQHVRPRLHDISDVLFGRDAPPLAALQWQDDGRKATANAPVDWLGGPLAEDDVYLADAALVAVGASRAIPPGSVFGGLLLDTWREVVPDRTMTPALTTELPGPEARAPQALLLAVPTSAGVDWTARALFTIAEKAVASAKARVVAPADIPETPTMPRLLRDIGLIAPLGAMRSNETALTRAACPPREEG